MNEARQTLLRGGTDRAGQPGKFIIKTMQSRTQNLGWYPAMTRVHADDAGFAGVNPPEDAARGAVNNDCLRVCRSATQQLDGSSDRLLKTADGTAIATLITWCNRQGRLIGRDRVPDQQDDHPGRDFEQLPNEPAPRRPSSLVCAWGNATGGVTLARLSVTSIWVEDNENDPPQQLRRPRLLPLPSNPSQGGGGSSRKRWILGLLLLGLGRERKKMRTPDTQLHPSMSQLSGPLAGIVF